MGRYGKGMRDCCDSPAQRNQDHVKGCPSSPELLDEARLRELAEAATGGKWGAWVKSGVIQIDNRGGDGKNPAVVHWRGFDGNDLPLKANKANAAFIAAANPATILALLDALSAERERGDRADPRIAEWGYASLDDALTDLGKLLDTATAFDGLAKGGDDA